MSDTDSPALEKWMRRATVQTPKNPDGTPKVDPKPIDDPGKATPRHAPGVENPSDEPRPGTGPDQPIS